MSIAVTTGDPAGIGPDIALALADLSFGFPVTVLADIELLEHRAAMLGMKVKLEECPGSNDVPHIGNSGLKVRHIPLHAPVEAGTPDRRNAEYVMAQIDAAAAGCLDQSFAAMTTGPVSKALINQAGIAFRGHTEYLSEAGGGRPVMMLATGDELRVALVTTHLPLREVAGMITPEKLRRTLLVLNQDLPRYCGINHPRIGVCGLNPHAGEQGCLGHEDAEIIAPTVAELKKQGLDLSGPLPADTVFTKKYLTRFDVIVAMFHDQGLPVVKHSGFGKAVNVTLGLPFLRTSVDHGTAFEIAGSGAASCSSLAFAIHWTKRSVTRGAD